MFMCFNFVSSVINMIYSGKPLFSCSYLCYWLPQKYLWQLCIWPHPKTHTWAFVEQTGLSHSMKMWRVKPALSNVCLIFVLYSFSNSCYLLQDKLQFPRGKFDDNTNLYYVSGVRFTNIHKKISLTFFRYLYLNFKKLT
jgi:hypothetical protein